MKTVEQLARETGMVVYEGDQDRVLFDGRILEALQRFHDLAIAQYREGLLAGVGEAVALIHRFPEKCSLRFEYTDEVTELRSGVHKLYTADQMAAAVAIERSKWENAK